MANKNSNFPQSFPRNTTPNPFVYTPHKHKWNKSRVPGIVPKKEGDKKSKGLNGCYRGKDNPKGRQKGRKGMGRKSRKSGDHFKGCEMTEIWAHQAELVWEPEKS